MISIDSRLSIEHQKAMLTGSSFEYDSYRNGFDLSIPVYNSLTAKLDHEPISWLVIFRFIFRFSVHLTK